MTMDNISIVLPMDSSLDIAQVIDLPRVTDPRGNLSFVQKGSAYPFEIKRVYWIYDVPGGKCRNGRALLNTAELIVALSGSFDVVFDNGIEQQRVHLCRSYQSIYLPALTWRVIDNFSSNSVAMVLSSRLYDADEYIYDYSQFKEAKANKKI